VRAAVLRGSRDPWRRTQKSAEAVVGSNAEGLKTTPRVGQMISRRVDEAELGVQVPGVQLHRATRESVQQLMQRVREQLRSGRGRSLLHTIEHLNPLLRGWISYFQLTQNWILETLDGWVRRRLRCLLWRQWKQPRTRKRRLQALGLDIHAARGCAGCGRGPWWNAGARHLHIALPAAYFTRLGLVSLLVEQQRLQCAR